MKSSFKYCFSFAFYFLLTACSSSSGGGGVSNQLKIKGDPMSFIAFAKKDSTSGIPVELFEDGAQWQYYSFGIIEQPQEEVGSQEEAEEKNAPKTDGALTAQDIKDQVDLFKLSNLDGTTDQRNISFTGTGSLSYGLRFNRHNDKLLLNSYSLPRELSDVLSVSDFKVQHYSVSENKKSFSILFSSNWIAGGEKARTLVAVYFTLKERQNIVFKVASETYNYLFGQNYKVAWSQEEPLEMEICYDDNSEKTSVINERTDRAINTWSNILEERLEIKKTESYQNCAPFSDLNHQTIVRVPKWIEVANVERFVHAATITVPNFYEGKIIDGDIFYYEDDVNQAYEAVHKKSVTSKDIYDSYKFKKDHQWTMTHELGHLLGLHHIFDGTPSVMSYDDQDRLSLYDYDRRAIHELYPEK